MNADKIRTVLNVIFMIGALVSIILYFAIDDKITFFYVCGATICVKLMEFFIRFIHR